MKINIKFSQRWVEWWALFCIVIGFLLGASLQNPWLAYVAAMLTGAILGRLLWRFKTKLKGGILFIILASLIGFLLGVQNADRKILIVLFVLGIAASFYVHDQKLIRSAEY
jgi:predicted branched-subunit amino acid permease